jgi:hypothetical protein
MAAISTTKLGSRHEKVPITLSPPTGTAQSQDVGSSLKDSQLTSLTPPIESNDPYYVSPPLVDSDFSAIDDGESAVGGFSTTSSTEYVNSSIYDTIEENGRTYHQYKEGKYYLPNDTLERDRLNLQHALFGLTFHNNLYLAPIGKSLQHVLDIGTGTGVWAIDCISNPLFPPLSPSN